MAAMTTVLTEFADNGNSRTYTSPAHTSIKPALVIQKRKVPTGNQVVVEDTISTIYATEDAAGVAIPQRVSISITVRRPINGIAADMTAVVTLAREIVASDEFQAMVDTQNFVQ
jgi:hypothetical protein